jgi:hypothetical protein
MPYNFVYLRTIFILYSHLCLPHPSRFSAKNFIHMSGCLCSKTCLKFKNLCFLTYDFTTFHLQGADGYL